MQPFKHLFNDLGRDFALATGQFQRVEKRQTPINRPRCDGRQIGVGDEHMPRFTVEPLAFALRAGLDGNVLGQFIPYDAGIRFAVAALEIGDDAGEGVPAFLGAAVPEVVKFNDLVPTAIQDDIADFLRQFIKRRIDVEAIVF